MAITDEFNIIRYSTLEECMSEFFNCPEDELPDMKWTWYQDGKAHVWPMKRAIRNRKKKGLWGWVENKTDIHVWISDHAKPKDIIYLIGHELGHKERPYHKTSILEEAKADNYGVIAREAFNIMLAVGGFDEPKKIQ